MAKIVKRTRRSPRVHKKPKPRYLGAFDGYRVWVQRTRTQAEIVITRGLVSQPVPVSCERCGRTTMYRPPDQFCVGAINLRPIRLARQAS